MSKKFYVVRKGRNTGIFNTWNECKKQVDGFSGAEYKSFTSHSDAKIYLSGSTSDFEDFDENMLIAYVDGSYEHSKKQYGSGVVIIKNDKVIAEFSKKGNDDSLVGMRNVAGEIEASKIAMMFCIENKISFLEIRYDYEGIEKWCTGAWKTNKEGTMKYKKFFDDVKPLLKVRFVKVKAHSGNEYNDRADELAKEAIGIF